MMELHEVELDALELPQFQIVIKEQIHKLRLDGRDFLKAGVYKIFFPFSFSYNLKIVSMSKLYLKHAVHPRYLLAIHSKETCNIYVVLIPQHL